MMFISEDSVLRVYTLPNGEFPLERKWLSNN